MAGNMHDGTRCARRRSGIASCACWHANIIETIIVLFIKGHGLPVDRSALVGLVGAVFGVYAVRRADTVTSCTMLVSMSASCLDRKGIWNSWLFSHPCTSVTR